MSVAGPADTAEIAAPDEKRGAHDPDVDLTTLPSGLRKAVRRSHPPPGPSRSGVAVAATPWPPARRAAEPRRPRLDPPPPRQV